jgi:hypothetical protein
MRRSHVVSLVTLALFTAGAGNALGQGAADPVEAAGCTRLVDFATVEWRTKPHKVTHPLLPLMPGTQRVFEGRSNVTGAPLPHRVTFTVTSLTKVVDGVRTAVVWDVDESDGEVTEAELAVFAKDLAGNVWNLGEYPEEYADGAFTGAPSTWFAGVGNAEPGIHMPASPDLGLPEYLQGFVPEIEFLDCATIFETGATIEVPAGSFSDVIVVHERSPLDPEGGVQVKYHAPGVGIVNIGALDDPEGETLELIEFNILSAEELQQANREAHILDQRGLQCSAVYAQTAPLEGPDDGDYGPYSCPVPPPPPFAGVTTPAPFSIPSTTAAAPPSRTTRGRRYRAWVDHSLFPLKRVRQMLFKGREDDVAIRVESRVRDTRVRVAGVRATAVDVEEREDGVLVERATDYYAQDRKGNVWYLGERVDNIENGRVVDHDGQWIAGRKGARRGLFLPAAPRIGQSFRQTRAPGVSKDRSTVVSLDARVSTAAGRFTGCLKTRDTDLMSRRRRAEHKYYCPDVGLVRERQTDGTVDLVKFR